MLTWAEGEVTAMKRIAACKTFAPRLYDHWNDRNQGIYVLVMEKIPGITLEKWLEEHPLKNPDGKALFLRNLILAQVADILNTIHDKIRLSHRDIKPRNIMLTRKENGHYQAYLIDFGTAGQNYIIGTGSDGYQAPEQLSPLPGDSVKADVFALGMMWHRMLSDIPARQTRWEFRKDAVAPVWKKRPSLPQWVLAQKKGALYQRLFEDMTAYDPCDRVLFPRICKTLDFRR